jgi:hypothetical protein
MMSFKLIANDDMEIQIIALLELIVVLISNIILFFTHMFLILNLYMQHEIISWLNATLEELVDYSPIFEIEYMLCYLKPKDLLPDCCDHLRIIKLN